MLIRQLERFLGLGAAPRASRRRPAFEALEDRILLAAHPVVALDVPANALIGGAVQGTATFTNVPDAAPGGANGYGPVLDLVIPTNGADGAGVGSTPPANNDGITLTSASYLGANLATQQVEFDAAGHATHPFLKDAAGNPLVVNAADFGAAPGDTLVSMQLPFGSVTPGQTPITVNLGFQVSNLADADTPLPITARGAFQFGTDALDNPSTDPALLGDITAPSNVTPTVLQITKTFSGPEGETVTGPNSPRFYTINVSVAPGQTLSNVVIQDQFADGIVVLDGSITTGPASSSIAYDSATNHLAVTFTGPITGDISITVPFYVGQYLAPTTPAAPVLDPTTGAPRTMGNDASAEADWTPIDPRDAVTHVVLDPPGFENVFTAKSLAVQKDVAVVVDVGGNGAGPDDTLQYTVHGQVSDYFTLNGIVLTDLLSDGQHLDSSFTPTIVVHEGSSALGSGNFSSSSFSITRDPTTGVSTLNFNLGQVLLDNGAPDGVLAGDATGTLGVTTFTIVYRAIVDRNYLAPPQGPVTQNDTIGNDITAGGQVIDGGVPMGTTTDDSHSDIVVTQGDSSKSVYALNGQTVTGPISIVSGDLVTFRLTRDFPQGTAAEFSLTDFLPLPIFDVAAETFVFQNIVSGIAPADGVVQWGPSGDAFRLLYGAVPNLSISVANNSLIIDFGAVGDGSPHNVTLDLLFTVKVQDKPLGDQLLLTNLATAHETNSNGTVVDDSDIAQVTLTEPKLRISKGVVATDDPDGVFTPGPTGPVAFDAPGSTGVRFSGVINSTNLASLPVDSDLSGVDAGAKVTFAVIIENYGTGKNGAFDVLLSDFIPQGLTIPPGSLNLQVTDGAGNALAYTFTSNANDGLGARLVLTDAVGAGAIGAFDPTSGRNIVVITFDGILAQTVEPGSQLTNVANIESYAAFEGGQNRTPNQPQTELTDTASVEVTPVSLIKTVVATSLAETGSSKGDTNLADLAIGETVTFEITVTLPEGQVRGLVLQDLLPVTPGTLKLIDATVVSIGSNLYATDLLGNIIGPANLSAAVLADRNGDNFNDTITWTASPRIQNIADNIHDGKDTIVLRVTAIVADTPDNVAGDRLVNTAQATHAVGSAGTVTDSATATVEVVEPNFVLNKTVTPTTAVGNDTVIYTVTLTPAANQTFTGPAYNVVLDDQLIPGEITLDNVVSITGPAGTTLLPGPGLHISVPILLPTDTITIVYTATLDPGVLAGEQLVNTVVAQGYSTPAAVPGVEQRHYELTDTAVVQVPGVGISKVVTATSDANTGSALYNGSIPDLVIGETVDFTITMTLPRALSQGLNLQDLLPVDVPGSPTTSGVLAAFDAQVLSIGSSLSGATPVITLTGSVVNIAFGDVLNSASSSTVGADEQITVLIRARLVDNSANVAADVLTNRATISYDTGTGIQSKSATAQVEVVEPNLAVDKTANVMTGDAGDVVTYNVSIQRNIDAPAYDLTISDPLNPDLVGIAGSGVIVSGPAGATIAYNALTNSFVITAPSYLPTDPLLVISYQARIATTAYPAEVIQNTASVTWDSQPGDPGAGNQRAYGPASDTYAVTVPGVSISKEVSGTTINTTGTDQFDPQIEDLTIGEFVRFTITLDIPEGSTSLNLTDVLPVATGIPGLSGKLTYVLGQVSEIGANISGSLLSVGQAGTYDAGTNTVTFNFGNIVNAADNVHDARDRITVSVIALLSDLPENQAGDLLTNQATATFTGGVVSDTASVEIVAPILQVTKVVDQPVADAGDILTYTVTVPQDPSSTTAAYNVVMLDQLGPGLELVVGSVTASTAAGGVTNITSGNTAGDTSVRVTYSLLTLGEPAPVITYQVRVTDAALAGSTITNTAHLDYTSSPILGRQEPSLTATADVSIPGSTLAKVVAATGLSDTGTDQFVPTVPDVALGETVTYRLTATLVEGTQTLRIADTLPDGLTAISATVISLGDGTNITGATLAAGASGTITGQGILFDFGTAVVNRGDNNAANNTVVVEVVARVVDITGRAAGDTLVNAARLDYGAGYGAPVTAPVEVVLPDLALTKTVAAPASGDAGDTMTYTVTAVHTGSSTAAAYDLVLTDLLASEKLVYVAGSATATLNGVTVGSFDTTGGDLRFTLDALGLTAGTLTITYQAKLADTVEPGGVIVNSAALTYDTAPGVTPGERDFAPPAQTATVNATLPATLVKTITASDVAATPDGTAAPGETLTYTLVTHLSEGTQKVVVGDTLPNGMEVISATVVSIGTGITNTAGLTAGSAGVITGQGVTFDFGTVVNPGDNNTAGDTIVVQILARVRDATPGGTVLTNAAVTTVTDTAGGNAQTPMDDVSVTVVTPVLVFDKSVESYTPGDAGTEAVFVLTLSHGAGSTGPAFGSITDTLPAGLRDAVILSVTGPAGSATVTGDTITMALAATGYLTTDANIVVRFSARLSDAVQDQIAVINDASVTYRPSPTGGIPVTLTDDASVIPLLPASLVKTITASDVAATPDGTAAPGETLTYTLVTRLSEGTQKLVVGDTLPNGMEVVSATVVSIGGGITNTAGLVAGSAGTISGQAVSFDFGTIVNTGDNNAANDTITIQILARVRDATPGGTVLTNAAIATVTDTSGGHEQTPTDSVPVTVVTPVLVLDKAVESYTPGDAGTEAIFTITLSHGAGSTGPAFGSIIDTLPAGLRDAVILSITGPAGTPTISGNIITVPLAATGYLTTDANIVIRFSARLSDSVQDQNVVTNDASITYRPSPTGGIPVTLTDSASVTPTLPATLVKTITASDVAATPDGTAAPGETLTYTLVTHLSEGTQKLVVGDTLPGGLEVLSATVVSIGAGINNTAGLVAGSAGVISGQGVTFDFGTVVNPGDNNAAGDLVTVQIIARVRDATPGGTVLDNAAIATVTDTSGGNVQTPTDDVAVTVVTPVLVFDKSVESYTPGDAGTEAVFVLTLSHGAGSTGPAFGSIVDTLPAGLRDATILSITGPAGTATISGNLITIPIAAGGFLTTDPAIVIRFSARLSDNVENGVTVTNDSSVTYRPSPTGGIPVTLTDSASIVPLLTPGFTKTIVASDNPDTAPGTVAIGEIVTYDLRLNVAEGTQKIVLSDTLPNGMQLIDATIVYAPGAITAPAFANGTVVTLSGTAFTLNFGTVVNTGDNIAINDAIHVFVRARLVDTPGVDAGDLLVNAAVLTTTTTANVPVGGDLTGAVPIQVVEPELVLSKSVQGFARPGETAPYTLVLAHDASSTAVAYDVAIADLLQDPGLSLVPGSVTVSDNVGGATGAVITSNNGVLGVFVARLAQGEVVTVHFNAMVSSTTIPTSSLPNTATVDWTSSPGATTGERAYATDASAVLRLAPVITKDIIDTSIPETGSDKFNPGLPDLGIGETVTYRVSILVPQALLTNVTLTDLLPGGLTPLSAQVESVGAGILGIAAGTTGVINGQTVTFAFGNVVNAGGTGVGAGDLVTILVQARVTDAATNVAGHILTNAASLGFTINGESGTSSAVSSAEVVIPELTIAKTVTPDFQAAGQTVTHQLTVNHTGNSTEDAFDVRIADTATGSSVEQGSVVVTGSASAATITYQGTGFVVTLARLALGETVTITYRAILDTVPPVSGQVVNTAVVEGDSLPGGAGIPQHFTAADAQATVIVNGGPPQPPEPGPLLGGYFAQEPNLRVSLRPEIGFAGTAEPGALLMISLRDAFGRVVATADARADAGGNWLTSLPALIPWGSQLPNTGDYFGNTRLFADLTQSLVPIPAPMPGSAYGDLNSSPFTIEVTVASGLISGLTDVGGNNNRIYFHDLTTGGVFVTDGQVTLREVFGGQAGAEIASQAAAAREPFSFARNKFTAEFLSAGAIPGAADR